MIRVAGYGFKPGKASSVAVLLLLPVLVGMGVFQLHRAEWKTQRLAQIAAADAGQVADLNQAQTNEPADFSRVLATGRFDGDRQLLLDNRVRRGQAGYEVLTPFLPAGSERYVLVNRGWLAAGGSRAEKPAVTLSLDSQDLSGRLVRPEPGVVLGEMLEPGTDWPRVIEFVDYRQLSDLLGVPLMDYVIELAASHPLALDTDWPVVGGFGPERHVAYAVQWFAMALCLLVLYIKINLQKLS